MPGEIERTIRNLREVAPTIYLDVPKGWEEIVVHLRRDAELRRVFFSRVQLFFYAGDGQVLGYLGLDATGPARWHPEPGAPNPVPSLDRIANPHLRRVIGFLLAGTRTYFETFLADLRNAQTAIEPEFAGRPVPMGQPLVLVRASLSLELRGPPALHQGWNEFLANMRRRRPDSDNFTRVRFPIRLGEQDQLNDGLAVYWVEDEAGAYVDNAYVVPNYDIDTDNPDDKKCDFLYQAIDDPPLNVTMLIDPRAMVHAATGILPTKAIRIPPHHYEAAMRLRSQSPRCGPSKWCS